MSLPHFSNPDLLDRQPSAAFVGASWVALGLGLVAFIAMLANATTMPIAERGFYFVILMYGLFAAVSVQKSVRDRAEGVPVTGIYYGLSWVSVLLSITLLGVGLFNTALLPAEKGFYGISFTLCLFGAIAVQKNTRDKSSS